MDTTRRRVVAMVTGWVVVVLVVGGLTFAVVSRAGSEVGQVSALRTVVTDGPDDPSTTGGPTSPGPTRTTPTPTRSSEGPDDDPSTPPATLPTHSRTTPPGATSSPTRTTRPPSPPAPTRRTASFTTEGGTLVASCTGSAIRRESITVRYGWRVEEEVGRTRLSVHFTRVSGGDGDREGAEVVADGDGEVELTVACVQGVPTRTSH